MNMGLKKYFLFTVSFFFISILFLGCISNPADTSDTNVGTIANRPRLPYLDLFPDFDTNLPETALGTDSAADADVDPSALTLEEAPGFSITEVWESIFISGGIAEGNRRLSQLEVFGETVAPLIEAQGVTTASTEVQTIRIEEAQLFSSAAAWDIEIQQDTNDEEYIRYYFRNVSTGFIQATYLLKTDSDGNPLNGFFVHVDPELLTTNANSGRRLFALAFDFTDSTQNLFVLREEAYHSDLSRYYIFHVHEQCHLANQSCLGEYQEITVESPERELEGDNIRFSWNETTADICIADVDYSSGALVTRHTYQFIGPEAPTEDEITTDTCTVDTPYWGTHVYTTQDLPFRYEDTDPQGGTASTFFVDGLSTAGWDTLTPTTGWLDASFLNQN